MFLAESIFANIWRLERACNVDRTKRNSAWLGLKVERQEIAGQVSQIKQNFENQAKEFRLSKKQ